ncbi:XPA-binding protein, putative [Eimeria necatrix]|uniref:XPA-binding protein, putative n=1 Tax=Eimeria necatrix TaxID=51315 RepID=U6MNU3_9EIME|nr:XPA-binding protein, putative [Eimeria necatrix]CDJ65681.1 XPA-binding protein, putative [Eimeria necatrix]
MAVAGNAGRAREEKPAAPSSPEGPTSAEKENEEDEFEVSARAAAAAALELDELVGGDADIAYEQELRRDPYQVKVWLAYLKSRAKAKPAIRFVIYERAVRSLPGSYKLWRLYLLERVALCERTAGPPSGPEAAPLYSATNSAFERCLVHLSRMPEIWRMNLKFLQQQQLLTRVRRTFDAALRALAVTQHELLWPEMMDYVKSCGVPETAVCLYRRWIMIEPERTDEFALYLSSIGRYDEAASYLAAVASDSTITTASGRTRHELWLELCKLVAAHPESIHSMRVEDILRSGIARFSDAVASLWCSLASHYVRMGLLAKARDIYEEAVSSVSTIRDLAVVYEAYAAFEEAVVAQLLQEQQQASPEAAAAAAKDIDFAIARLERLTERRPLLISSCKLRQNPHNVHEWLARAELVQDDNKKVVETFTEAVATVKADQAVGRLGVLWIAFARFYEAHGDLENAAKVFERAVQATYRTIDDLASVWCEAVEMHLRHGLFKEALRLVRLAISSSRKGQDTKGAQGRLFRSVKLWSLAADVEEMFGSIETVRACYDKMFQLKVITPQLVINYAHYLEERRYYEESFRVYERGVAAFHWPHVNAIWLMYLTKFVSRYRSTKLERARELFQQATAEVPPKYAKNLFLLYAKLEETYGLAKHALAIYSAATKAVLPEDKLDMFCVYIARTSELFGVARTRKIFEEAIETLPSNDVRNVCMRYAAVEKSLGEIDRARAIFQHAAHLCDPSRDQEFWDAWRELEVAYGNEDTFKDMLRIKRSVIAQYSQVHHNVAELTASEVPKPLPADPVKEAAAQLAKEDEERQQVLRREEALQEQLRFQQKQQAEMQELEQAEAEFQELQRSRRQAATLASLQADAPLFVSASTFEGAHLGYAFKHGPQGLGYYLDEGQVGKGFIEAREKSLLGRSRPGGSGSSENAPSGSRRQDEEMEIDIND